MDTKRQIKSHKWTINRGQILFFEDDMQTKPSKNDRLKIPQSSHKFKQMKTWNLTGTPPKDKIKRVFFFISFQITWKRVI